MEMTQETKSNDTTGQSSPAPLRKRWWIWLLVICLIAIGAYLYLARSSGAPSPPRNQGATVRSVPVVAAEAKKGDVRIYLTGLGSVTPLATVTLKSRVDGELMKVLFQEGQIVSTGQLLTEIDRRPYEAQLLQAEGQLIRDQALLDNARLDLKRYQVLVEQDSAPTQQRDTQEALVRQYEGTVKTDQGQVDNAKVQLIYTRITSPVSGRIGLRLVDPGNIVHATDTTGLAVITQLQPITVIFTIAEDNLPAVLHKIKVGERLPVDAFNREETQKIATGYLLTVDNQIDPTTGTVRLKAIFPNQDYALFPNQFVNAHLLLETKRDATIVPTAAIQQSSQGKFVYKVKADRTVAMQSVRVGPTEGDNVSIEGGLSLGDLVVVEGAERLKDGSKVELQSQPANSTPHKSKG
ncbi:MAG: MdtA/MuxA family multidrug efflux RND transporter periplasmic adaptor subunit [Thermodesulfovibrionales bacterium]|jgi:multidrug efflux system membrane fusion protein